MIKKIIFFLLFSVVCHAQEIIGVWAKDNMAIEFTAKGEMKLMDLKTGESALHNLTLKYRLENENNINYIAIDSYYEGKLIEQQRNKYKIEKGVLYLPSTTESSDGKITVHDYKEAYERVE